MPMKKYFLQLLVILKITTSSSNVSVITFYNDNLQIFNNFGLFKNVHIQIHSLDIFQRIC